MAAASVPHFGLPMLMRVVTGMAYAGFWAVAPIAADRRGRAMSVVVSGLDLAVIVGVPADTPLAQHTNWQADFRAAAGAALGNLENLPSPAAAP
ncbi:hypothetical protein [Streptomyces rubradiris]|nr:hypothetical protein [Streptomyces rubradiris]